MGDVYDIFCPGKRDRERNLFGFVRFPKRYEENELFDNLNKIWIGSFKLRIFFPRFKREQKNKTEFQKQKIIKLPIKNGFVEENRSFTDAINEIRKERGQEEVDNVELQYQSVAEDKVLLDGCYVGFLKSEFTWEEHSSELLSECGGSLILRSMGGNLILFQKGTYRVVNDTITKFDEWIKFWFD